MAEKTEVEIQIEEASQFPHEEHLATEEKRNQEFRKYNETNLTRRTGKKISFQVNREKDLPLSLKDLANTPFNKKASNWRDFQCHIPPKLRGIFLFICLSYLYSLVTNWTDLFDFQSRESTKTPQSLLSFGEAFDAFFPEMKIIAQVKLCYVVAMILIWPLYPGVQIFFVLALICAVLLNFPELVHKAWGSGIDVAFGPFKLPLIWFTTLGALGLSLIGILLTLLVVYFIWIITYKGRPRVKETEASLDVDAMPLPEILTGGN